MKKKLKIAALIVCLLVSGTLLAGEESSSGGLFPSGKLGIFTAASAWGIDFAYKFDDNQGYGAGAFAWPNYSPAEIPSGYVLAAGDQGRKLGSGWGGAEAQAWYRYTLKVPFLAGDSPFTSGNNLTLNARVNLAPVLVEGHINAVWTPLAFLQIEAGTLLGTGWPAIGLSGLGLNNDGTGTVTMNAFDGVLSRSWGAATFQFDLAALWPGDWHHIVMAATAKFEYQVYSRAGKDDAWGYMADQGENFNGFRHLGTYLLGYQMPIRLNTAAIMVETIQRLGDTKTLSTIAGGGWGSDFITVRISPVFIITLPGNSSLTVALQASREPRYTDDTVFNKWFQNRVIDQDSRAYWKLRRLALAWSMKF